MPARTRRSAKKAKIPPVPVLNEKTLERVVNTVPGLITVYNINTGKYVFVNKSLKKILGYPPSDFIQKGVVFASSLVHPDDIETITEKNIQALQRANDPKHRKEMDKSIVTFKYRMRHKNGSWRWLHTDGTVFSRDRQGKVEMVMNISIDVTETQRSIMESEERYKVFLHQSSEAIWRFEVDKQISIKLPVKKQIELMFKHAYLAECNDVCAKMYGFEKAEDIIGAKLPEMLVQDDPQNIEYLTAFIESGYKLSDAQSSEVDKKGNTKYFSNSLIGIVENEYLIRAWGTQRDITEQRKTEKQKDDFIAIASHELKTPLTSIKAYTQILRRKFEKSGDEKTAQQLIKMDGQLNKLTELIGDLLDVSKIESGKLQLKVESFDVSTLIQEIIDTMQMTTEKHKIINENQLKITVTSDRERVGQILSNFISNAIKYSPNADKIIVKTKKEKNTIQISVQDFGIGIPKSDLEKVFGKFYRSGGTENQTYPGLGLGLYISAEIAHRIGGKIWVESEEGKGSLFNVTIPIK